MATIKNATGLYNTLGYKFDDPNGAITTLSIDTQKNLDYMPPMMQSGFVQDIIANTATGYFQNPVANTINAISSSCHTIYNLCNLGGGLQGGTTDITNKISDIRSMCYGGNLPTSCTNYYNHTDRISGVTDQSVISQTQPNYNTAISLGKLVMYLTNQTDSVTNNSPILGSFTSIFVGPQLTSNANSLLTYTTTLNNSVSFNSGTGVYTSNLTLTQVSNIYDGIVNVNTFLNTRRTHDENFYQKSRNVVSKYGELKGMNMMGESESHLVNNFIGTSKLISRINT